MFSAPSGSVPRLLAGFSGLALLFNSGCGILPVAQRKPDHVFSSSVPEKVETPTYRA